MTIIRNQSLSTLYPHRNGGATHPSRQSRTLPKASVHQGEWVSVNPVEGAHPHYRLTEETEGIYTLAEINRSRREVHQAQRASALYQDHAKIEKLVKQAAVGGQIDTYV
ncbi:MAG: hypothetical protein BMS9Abin36_1049 [Gammaproteobacteria bacterium]|nr:MAG: hypothetical protein BMS9Abin36_1049 [Gammaproteobacteria bacterium]